MTRLFFALALIAAPLTASAGTPVQSPGNFGLGLGAGTHVSGISGKYWLASDFSAQAVVGAWGLGRGTGGALGVSADGLFELPRLLQDDALDIGWNIGPGVNLAVGNAVGLGVNGVLGLEFNIHAVPIDIVLEYRPGISVIPDVNADLIGFGGHIRVYPF